MSLPITQVQRGPHLSVTSRISTDTACSHCPPDSGPSFVLHSGRYRRCGRCGADLGLDTNVHISEGAAYVLSCLCGGSGFRVTEFVSEQALGCGSTVDQQRVELERPSSDNHVRASLRWFETERRESYIGLPDCLSARRPGKSWYRVGQSLLHKDNIPPLIWSIGEGIARHEDCFNVTETNVNREYSGRRYIRFESRNDIAVVAGVPAKIATMVVRVELSWDGNQA